ncbi:MAG: choice-of-anchor tandem repeat GloVer-containing protein, partial [Candidatus Baltobacteraceae bacterium]
SDYGRSALGICATVAVLSGCGGLQPPVGAPSATQQIAHRADTRGNPLSYAKLYNFGRLPDGHHPGAGLVDVNGTLYGTTVNGGAYACGSGPSCGTVFSITTGGKEKVLHSFGYGADGFDPGAELIAVKGTLYGTTTEGGAYGQGTVFSITTHGTEKVLYSFGGGTDGAYPDAALVDVNGTLYGTTTEGGTYACGGYDCGTVFSVTTSGKEKVLYSFGGGTDGAYPYAELVEVNGTLYGTTIGGGGYGCLGGGCGTIFSITTGGSEKVLYSFKGGSGDGEYPKAGLINVKGTLYGTTANGGGSGSCYRECGTAFSITRSGKEKVLHSFDGGTDGAYPGALVDVNGTLYGTTTSGGGLGSCGSGGGCGTVFSITTSGKEKVLHSFGYRTDGYYPSTLVDVNRTLYGTTFYGGTFHGTHRRPATYGTVFALTP